MDGKDILIKTAMLFPDREILVSPEKRLTGKDVLDRAFRLANAFLDLGLKKGDRIGVLLTNSHQSVESFCGIMCAGMARVPLNMRNSAREHLYILNNSGASAVMVGPEYTKTIGSILSEAESLKYAVCVSGEPLKPMLSYEDLIAGASPREPDVSMGDDDIFRLSYTSGTTGVPKGVVQHNRAAMTSFHNVLIDGLDIKKDDVVALTSPVTHASGAMILPHFIRGAKVVILPGFDAKQLLQTVEKERVTTLYLVPTTIVMLLNDPDLKKYDLSSVKSIRYGASPIAPDVLKQAIETFGNVFLQGYGLTEGSMPLTLLTKEDHMMDGSEKKLKRLASVGREVTVAKVRIMGDDGQLLPPGEIGEIVAQSDQVMREYWNNPEATAEAFQGGWLHTRDMGYMDEDGYVFLVDRKGDMIVTGGFNVYPKEVEDVLYMHPAVLEAAVFGVPDAKWGETVKAAVALKKGMTATEDEIIEFSKKHLAGYKKPTSVDFIDALPKNDNGKILRKDLKAPYWQGRERQIS
ncbi:MAG: long-chain-fatty-acid--CoA ligase [Deltaproteobacteria bacterium]|nr:long-chain-fatty-acid--CoA ligase [Deltaproteobacteria bacterium]